MTVSSSTLGAVFTRVAVLFGGALVGWLALVHVVAAQDRLSGEQCSQRAAEIATAAGAQITGTPQAQFLVEKESRALPFTIEQAGCVGFLAVGHGMVKDLDLALHASTGVMLAQDAAQDSHPYVRYCGAAGLSLHLVMQMYEGRGEVTVLALRNAPQELGALSAALAGCAMPAPDTSALIDVGPEPMGPSLAETYSALNARLVSQGYRHTQVLIDDVLSERRRVSREVELKAGGCYALALIGDSTVEDMDLRVVSNGAEPMVLGEDTSRDRNALIKFCPTAGALTLDIRMYQGQGRFQAHAFAAATPSVALPPGVEGNSRSRFAEITASMARRGMQPSEMTWALAEPGGQFVLPVALRGGHCYAIGGIVGPEIIGADLDLRLLDRAGRLLAWELGPSDQPLMFHCPAQDVWVRVMGEAHGVRAPGRFLIIVAQDAALPAGDKS